MSANYTPIGFNDNDPTKPLSAARLAQVEVGIAAVDTAAQAAASAAAAAAAAAAPLVANRVPLANLPISESTLTLPPQPGVPLDTIGFDGDSTTDPVGNVYVKKNGTWGQPVWSPSPPPGVTVPAGALATYKSARIGPATGTGVLNVLSHGHSIVAGQSGGTNTDATLYGFVGRLAAILAHAYGAAAEAYTIGQNLFTSNPIAGPYSNVAGNTVYDGGIGQVYCPNATGVKLADIAIPLHPTTGAAPTSVDLLWVDMGAGTASWGYQLDGGSTVSVSSVGGNATGGGILSRTTVALTGGTAHILSPGFISATTTWGFVGHVVTYGTSGVRFARQGIPGYRAVDYAVGGGTTASSTGGLSVTPDHIKPISGVQDANNTAGSGFPFSPDLFILMCSANDCTYGANFHAYRRSILRMIHAARRGKQNASVILIAECYPSFYSDNAGATSRSNFYWDNYKGILREIAHTLGCVFIDMDILFTETPVANGLMVSGDLHPTSKGNGAARTSNVAITSGSPVVLDPAAKLLDKGGPISGTGIPANSYVGYVTPGVGYRLSSTDSWQTDVNATATNGAVSVTIGHDGHLFIANILAQLLLAA